MTDYAQLCKTRRNTHTHTEKRERDKWSTNIQAKQNTSTCLIPDNVGVEEREAVWVGVPELAAVSVGEGLLEIFAVDVGVIEVVGVPGRACRGTCLLLCWHLFEGGGKKQAGHPHPGLAECPRKPSKKLKFQREQLRQIMYVASRYSSA